MSWNFHYTLLTSETLKKFCLGLVFLGFQNQESPRDSEWVMSASFGSTQGWLPTLMTKVSSQISHDEEKKMTTRAGRSQVVENFFQKGSGRSKEDAEMVIALVNSKGIERTGERCLALFHWVTSSVISTIKYSHWRWPAYDKLVAMAGGKHTNSPQGSDK